MLLEIVTLLIAIGYILNRFYFSGAKCLTQNRLDNKIVIIVRYIPNYLLSQDSL